MYRSSPTAVGEALAPVVLRRLRHRSCRKSQGPAGAASHCSTFQGSVLAIGCALDRDWILLDGDASLLPEIRHGGRGLWMQIVLGREVRAHRERLSARIVEQSIRSFGVAQLVQELRRVTRIKLVLD